MSNLRQRTPKSDVAPVASVQQHPRATKQIGVGWAADAQGPALWIAVFVVVFTVPAAVHLIEGRNTLAEVSKAWPMSEFDANSAGRAHKHTEFLAGLGVHMAGSVENDQMAAEYLINELLEIRSRAQQDVQVEVGIQRPSGAMNIKFLHGMTLAYQNLTNVVVRISNASAASSEEAIILNAHFDAMVGSTAAADDGAQVGVLLEVARVLASGMIPLERAVVILLNGAEESICSAAHGFIATDDPILLLPEAEHGDTAPPDWKSGLVAAVVLEAMGSGGREMLLRSTPNAPWLSKLYRDSVRVPRATVIAEEIFRTGVFPGETDLFVFRDHGGLPGIDLLFVEDGYSYHSMQDQADRVQADDLQRCGAHTLAIVHALLSSSEPSKHRRRLQAPEGDPVFFDVLGFYLVWYTHTQFKVVHYGTAAVGLVYWMLSPRPLRTISDTFITFLACILGGMASGVVAHNLNPLSWYSTSWLALLIFVPAATAGALLSRSRLTPSLAGPAGPVGFMSVALVLLTLLGVRSGYVFVIAIAPTVVVDVVGSLLGLRGGGRGMAVLAACSLSVAYWSQVLRTVLLIFMPVMGRSGMFLPADAFIATATAHFLAFLLLLPLSLLASRRAFLCAGLACAVVSVGGLALSVQTRPYSVERPKRLFVQHTHRVYYDHAGNKMSTDGGLWVNGFDARRNEDLRSFGVREWEAAQAMDCYWLDCNNPFYLPLPLEFSGGWLLPSPPPVFEEGRAMEVLVQREERAEGVRRVHVTALGPSHMALVLQDPARRVEEWSLASAVGVDGHRRGSEGVVFTFFTGGAVESRNEWKFWLDIRGHLPVNASAYGHYLDFSKTADNFGCRLSPEMAQLQAKLPEWVCPTCWRNSLHVLQL